MQVTQRLVAAVALVALLVGVSFIYHETRIPRPADEPALSIEAGAKQEATAGPQTALQLTGASSALLDRVRARLPKPDPRLSPEEVIRTQLEALRRNDRPYKDAGIETAFNFASPANRRYTGPLERYVEMLYSPIYRPMINHLSVRFEPIEVSEQEARQAVVLVGEDALRVGYIFILSRQEEASCDGCWMTDSVIRYEVPEQGGSGMKLVKTSAH